MGMDQLRPNQNFSLRSNALLIFNGQYTIALVFVFS